MEDFAADYGESVELKIILANANGTKRTINLVNPQEDPTEAANAFAELVLNSETNIFAVSGEQPVSMVIDKVFTTREQVGEYGQYLPLYARPSVFDTGGESGTFVSTVYNGSNETTINVVDDEDNLITTNYVAETGKLTINVASGLSGTAFVIIENGDDNVSAIRLT